MIVAHDARISFDGAATACMNCSAVWQIVKEADRARLVELPPEQLDEVMKFLGPVAARYAFNRAMARALGIPLELLLKLEDDMRAASKPKSAH